MSRIRLAPERSAQARSAPPNPLLLEALGIYGQMNGGLRDLRIADQGCGQLRHFRLLAPISRELLLVDTEAQLSREHRDDASVFTVRGVAESEQRRRNSRIVRAVTAEEFQTSKHGLDLIVCVAVHDVVPPWVRRTIIHAASLNLRRGGHYLIVVPRNDSTILRRCGENNRYSDGHTFTNGNASTFFHNFRSTAGLIRLCRYALLDLAVDCSRYRHGCLLFRRE
jgi:SAM-dependent methyltransferase